MRFRSLALVALATFVLGAGSALACDKDGKTASAGSGCADKVASADAKVASSGSGCTAAKSADAQAASAGSGCCGAEAASAGAGCADKAASAGSGCTAAKSADAKVAGAGPSCHGENAAAAMVVYNVSGMTCGGCASKVEAAVANLKMDGVDGCTVDLEKGIAVVNVAEGKEIDSDALAKAITDAGFPAEMQKAEAETPDTAEPTETSTM